MTEDQNFFVIYLFAPFILAFGLIGNTLGITVVYKSKKLSRYVPLDMYKYLFITDTIFLVQIVINYFAYGFGWDLTTLSKYVCKMFWYINYTSDMMSPLILIYISAEKLVSIKYPARKDFFRHPRIQFIYLLIVIAYNSVYYLPILFFFKLKPLNEERYTNLTNQSEIVCDFQNDNQRNTLTYMDMSNRVIMPFVLMSILSFILLVSIVRLRGRISETYKSSETSSYRKEIQLSASLIFLNFFYVSLSLPLSIATFFSFSNFFFVLTFYLLYIIYSVNFYLLLVSNEIFRKEFFALFTRRNAIKNKSSI